MIEAAIGGILGFLLNGANPFIIGSVLLGISVWSSGRMAGQQLVTRLSKSKALAISLGSYAGFGLIVAGMTPKALEFLDDIETWQRAVVLVFSFIMLSVVLYLVIKGYGKRANN